MPHVKVCNHPRFNQKRLFRYLREWSIQLSSGINFDQSSNIYTTYLYRKLNKRSYAFQTGESIPINADSHTTGLLTNGVKVNIVVDIGAYKSFMSKSCYLSNNY